MHEWATPEVSGSRRWQRITLLLVKADQHAREGLRRAYDGEWDLEVVGEADSVVEALAELDRG